MNDLNDTRNSKGNVKSVTKSSLDLGIRLTKISCIEVGDSRALNQTKTSCGIKDAAASLMNRASRPSKECGERR
ncbi:hypothetical protein NPIL_567091 [Nephila pilipes]|uniref:Uncharacterized protein n=1 Tax=Nephila pilipes TaxID=299642 RepID=A0A8X6NZ02_NEPPI|nr:hypothetical protein NPIL_567091 [Nephila pilipes]